MLPLAVGQLASVSRNMAGGCHYKCPAEFGGSNRAAYAFCHGNAVPLAQCRVDMLADFAGLADQFEGGKPHQQLFVDAGTLVPGFTLTADGAEFFCHSPFIKHCEGGDVIRNTAALVFNIRLLAGNNKFDYLEIGDACWEDLEDIVRITKFHKNDDRLAWDLINIPHHCSYKSLSDEKGKEETEPKPLVKELLLAGKQDSYIVSCSKPVVDVKESYDQIQPPHIQARKAYERYLKEVKGRKFLVTMAEPNATKPEPLVFDVTAGGMSWTKMALIGASAIVASRPSRAG